jgi:hypothetical protein
MLALLKAFAAGNEPTDLTVAKVLAALFRY